MWLAKRRVRRAGGLPAHSNPASSIPQFAPNLAAVSAASPAGLNDMVQHSKAAWSVM